MAISCNTYTNPIRLNDFLTHLYTRIPSILAPIIHAFDALERDELRWYIDMKYAVIVRLNQVSPTQGV